MHLLQPKQTSISSPAQPTVRSSLVHTAVGSQCPTPHTSSRAHTPAHAGERSFFLDLPVELIAEILSQLDLPSLLIVSTLSRRLRNIVSDSVLCPWRGPVSRNICDRDADYEPLLKTLGQRSAVPRVCLVDILVSARADFILFETDIHLPDADYQEACHRRFLPSWKRWRTDPSSPWKAHYRKSLYRVVHRTTTTCTADEAWTKFVVLNRNGSANLLESASRGFSPQVLFNQMKIQNNLAHHETHIRLVVEFADVRIIALGVLNTPRSSLTVNNNARRLLQPPGLWRESDAISIRSNSTTNSYWGESTLEPLTHPQPTSPHRRYPLYTQSGEDKRWINEVDEDGADKQWVGPMLLCAQLCSAETRTHFGELPVLQDLDLVVGPGRNRYASFIWEDLDVIAPWLGTHIVKRINGQGLGL